MIDFEQVLADLNTRVATVTALKNVFSDGDERDFVLSNMPLADCRYDRLRPDIRAGQDYVLSTVFEIEVAASNLTSNREACKLRNSLLRQVMDAVRAQPRFSANVESVILGDVTFSNVKDTETKQFVASAVMQVIVMSFEDRS